MLLGTTNSPTIREQIERLKVAGDTLNVIKALPTERGEPFMFEELSAQHYPDQVAV